MNMVYDYARVQADIQPNEIAISMLDEDLTYGELESESNRLAGILIRNGLRPGDRVALLLEKTPDAIIAMHGIGKAGGVYIPIDIHSPAIRVAKILITSDISLMMVDAAANPLFIQLCDHHPKAISVPWVWWSYDSPQKSTRGRFVVERSHLISEPDLPHSVTDDPNQMAHILFTSGSTGDPKGVMITHQNIRTFVDWAVAHFGMKPGDRMSCHSPMHFDLSTFDIYGSLAAGSHLFLIPPTIGILPSNIANFIRSNRLTQWFSVPSVLSYLARFQAIPKGGFPDLKRLIWCGEVFPVQSLKYWMDTLPDVSFTNLYGPTEATIASSYHPIPSVPADDDVIPIGKACDGEALWILDEEMKVTSKGLIGDLYISGKGLSPGYWRDLEKTDASFKIWEDEKDNRIRIYKTGDLATMGENGLIYYHGRSDDQIKSRGYRIELGEIESAIDSLDILREFAVVPVKNGGFEGLTIGCAYVRNGDQELTPVDIKQRLMTKLPSYMMPHVWTVYEELPRNGNGKIDRKRLSDHFENTQTHALNG